MPRGQYPRLPRDLPIIITVEGVPVRIRTTVTEDGISLYDIVIAGRRRGIVYQRYVVWADHDPPRRRHGWFVMLGDLSGLGPFDTVRGAIAAIIDAIHLKEPS